MEFYRCEVAYKGSQLHGIYEWAGKIMSRISNLENKYFLAHQGKENQEAYQKEVECSQDFDWLEETMCYLDSLEIPPFQILKQGRCAYTEEGYKKFAEYIEDYKYIARKYGYDVEIKKVQPEKILYQDELQIVFQ